MINLSKIAVLSLMAFFSPFLYAADTPEEVARLLVQAIEGNDLEKYEGLILPASLRLYKERDSEMYKKQMELRFKRKKPSQYDSYEITITDIEVDKDSNITENLLRFYKNKWAKFPVKPEKRLNIIVVDGDLNNEGDSRWTGPYSSQVLSRYHGQWYIVYPNEFVEIK